MKWKLDSFRVLWSLDFKSSGAPCFGSPLSRGCAILGASKEDSTIGAQTSTNIMVLYSLHIIMVCSTSLSAHLLNLALQQNQRFSLYDPPLPSEWLPFFPLELSFPHDIYFAHCWDLTEAAQNLHQHNMAIRINHHCNATAIRIATADFVDAIPQAKCFLQKEPLDGSWPIPHLHIRGCRHLGLIWFSI